MIEGIDTSHWQGKVDWVKAYAKGVRFAWIKVSQGTNYADDMAAYNLPAAKAAGVKVGGYHFVTTDAASPQTTWFTQCLNAINVVWDLPPAMDVEYYTPVSLHNDNAQQSLRALSMVNPDYESLKYAVGNLTLSIPSESTVDYIGTRMIPWMNDHGLSSWGYPAIYTNPSSGNKVFVSAKMRVYNLWIAHWGVTAPTMPTIWKNEKYIAWQNQVIRGAQDWGVDGDVDHDYWGTKFPLTPAKENSLIISMPVTEFNSTYTGKLLGS